MGEIRLICPGCAAEYLLDDSAIPAAGRTVECTACGRVWHQPGGHGLRLQSAVEQAQGTAQRGGGGTIPPRRHAPSAEDDHTVAVSAPVPGEGDIADDAPPAPRLNRPLPAAVLTILQEEAARERAARQAATEGETEGDQTRDMDGESDRLWPATTVTAEPPRSPTIPPSARAAGAPVAKESTARHIHDHPMPAPGNAQPETLAATLQRSTPSRAHQGSAQPTPPRDKPAPAGRTKSRRRAGFWTGLLLAAAIAGVYVVAPHMPAGSPLADAAMALRGQLDALRLWLADLTGIAAG